MESELISLKCVNPVTVGAVFQLPYRLSVPAVDFSFLNSATSKGFLFEPVRISVVSWNTELQTKYKYGRPPRCPNQSACQLTIVLVLSALLVTISAT